MEEKKVTYQINGMIYNVTRTFKKDASSLLENLVDYFTKYYQDENVGDKNNDEHNTNIKTQNL